MGSNKLHLAVLMFSWLALAPLPLSHLGGPYDANSLLGWVSIGLLLIVSGLAVRSGKEMTIPRYCAWLIVCVVGISIVAIARPTNGLVAVPAILLLVFLLSFVVVRAGIGDVSFFSRALERVLLVSAVFLALMSAPSENYLGLGWSASIGDLYFPIAEGGFNQPNNFSSFLATVLAYSLWRRLHAADAKPQLTNALIAIYVFIGTAILLSGSRVGLLGFIAVVGIWGVLRGRESWTDVSRIAAVLLLSFLLSVLIDYWVQGSSSVVSRVAQLNPSESSISIRLSLLYSSWLIGMQEPLFGHGWYVFQNLYPNVFSEELISVSDLPYKGATIHPHNEIAQWWVVGGLVGVVLVVAPVLAFVVLSVGLARGWLGRFSVILPIGFHCLTEFPLYTSGFHWLLLILIFVVFSRLHVSPREICIRGVWVTGTKYFAGTAGLLVLVVSAHAAYVGHVAKKLAPNYLGATTTAQYIQARANDPSLTHWAHRTFREHDWTRHVFELAMQEGNRDLVQRLLPRMKAATQYFNEKSSWALLAGGYAGLGQARQLIGFVNYLERLDPSYASELRAFYGLPDTD